MRFLRPKYAAKHLGVGLTKFWDLAKNDPDFPTLAKLGPRTTVVAKDALDAYARKKTAPAQGLDSPKSAPVPPEAVSSIAEVQWRMVIDELLETYSLYELSLRVRVSKASLAAYRGHGCEPRFSTGARLLDLLAAGRK